MMYDYYRMFLRSGSRGERGFCKSNGGYRVHRFLLEDLHRHQSNGSCIRISMCVYIYTHTWCKAKLERGYRGGVRLRISSYQAGSLRETRRYVRRYRAYVALEVQPPHLALS